jgi:hypothetical protein
MSFSVDSYNRINHATTQSCEYEAQTEALKTCWTGDKKTDADHNNKSLTASTLNTEDSRQQRICSQRLTA